MAIAAVGHCQFVTEPDEVPDGTWYDESELRWDAVARVFRVLLAFLAVATVAGVWLIASRLVLDDLCQTTEANASRTVLEACQSRTSWEGNLIGGFAQALLPALFAIGGSVIVIAIACLTLVVGAIPRLAFLSNRTEGPALWAMWVLVALTGGAATWTVAASAVAMFSVVQLERAV